MERDSFVFYRSFKNAVCALPESMRLQMIMAILDYALDGKEPPPDGVERAILELIRPQLEANNKRYENGKKGGAPKGNKNAAKGKKTTENNQRQPNVNVNVNDNVNVNVNKSTIVDNARMSFCGTYGITTDAKPPPDIDFEKLSEAYSKSKSFLQNRAFAKHLSWIVKNYSKIIAGDYKDFQPTTSSPTPTKHDPKSIDHLFIEISEDAK